MHTPSGSYIQLLAGAEQDIRCLDDLTKSVWRFVETRPARLVRILWTYASTAATTTATVAATARETPKLRANGSDHLRPHAKKQELVLVLIPAANTC